MTGRAKDALAEGLRLLAAGDPWQAHEVWEDAWRTDASPHRAAWKGLIQVAAADWHRRRHHPHTVELLLAKARGHLALAGHLGLSHDQVEALLRLEHPTLPA